MAENEQEFQFDVFISYRWVEPDQSWVRDELVPALQQAGLNVCLDVNDFVPGRDLILEMTRARKNSRSVLCILSKDYFAGNRMVHFESLNARRSDPSGLDSRLVPLVFRPTDLPEWVRGLIPVDWTEERSRAREWRKLLKVLGASRVIPPPRSRQLAFSQRVTPIFMHDYNLPQTFVARDRELTHLTQVLIESVNTRTRVVTVTAIGGVGKSCLCRELIERSEIFGSFSRVIWFSFYEARDEAQDYFLREVLTHGFSWADSDGPLDGSKEHVRLRRELSKELNRDRTLLILDGVEVIQFTDEPGNANYGTIRGTWGEIDKLLRHVLNDSSSVCLLTSRVPLRSLENIRGYVQIPLDLFTPEDGAQLLRSLGVDGTTEVLEVCAEHLGRHALCLVAAGRYMARRKVGANRIADLVGDADVFQSSAEGEKVRRIAEWYRSELSKEQEYFLTRLSLHGRSVTASNYPVLIMGYGGSRSDAEVEKNIVQPLVERGLIDRLEGSDGVIRFMAHPLMKLAFSTWLEPDEIKRAHEDWARAAETAPGLFFDIRSATSLEELQPLVEATEHYLAANNWREAWNIFSKRGLGQRIGQLGFFELSLKLSRQFDDARSRGDNWSSNDIIMLLDRLAWLSNQLDRDDDVVTYRRRELAVAQEAQSPHLSQVAALVASGLAERGFVKEAKDIKTSDQAARGKISLSQGRYAEATKLLKAALKKSFGHERTSRAQPLAEALYRAGKFDEAASVLEEGLRIATESGFTCCRKEILSHLVELALRREDLSEAERWAGLRKDLLRPLGLDGENYWLLLTKGDFDGALKSGEDVTSTVPSALVRRHVRHARIFLRQGRSNEARVELEAAKLETSKSGFGQLNNDIAELSRELNRQSNMR